MFEAFSQGIGAAVQRLRFIERVPLAGLVAISLLAFEDCAQAAEIKIFTSRATATVLEKMGPEFERTHGHKLNVIADLTRYSLSKSMQAGRSISSSVPLRLSIH